MSEYRFGKQERLKSRKAITGLFADGMTVYSYPVKLLFHISKHEGPAVKCGLSVAKKKHRKAVTRNLLKRRIREAYRLNKPELIKICEARNISLDIFFIYLSEKVEDFSTIEEGVSACLNKLNKKNLNTSPEELKRKNKF